MSSPLPTKVVHSSGRKTTKFWRKQYGINVEKMHFIYATGMLPKHPCFTASKLLVKGFPDPTKAPFKATREIAMQRLYAILAPDMATPIARQRDENGKAKHVVVMRWIKGCTTGTGDVVETDQQKREFGAMAILDKLTDNSDRHAGNYVYSKEHLHPIDHEMSFYDPLERPDKCEYRINNMTHMQMNGALWMLNNISKNAHVVARWIRIGYFCEPAHQGNGRKFTAVDVIRWVDKVRPYVLCSLKKREGAYSEGW